MSTKTRRKRYIEDAGAEHRVAWNGECFCLGFMCEGQWYWQGLFLNNRPAMYRPLLRTALARLLLRLRADGVRITRFQIRMAH